MFRQQKLFHIPFKLVFYYYCSNTVVFSFGIKEEKELEIFIRTVGWQ